MNRRQKDIMARREKMGVLTFKGGIHPFDGKRLSRDCPIEKYVPKGEMVYPLSQHIGAPAVPLVKKGDRVLAGQKIAQAGGFVSAAIHASVSGVVKGVEKRLTATGNMVDSILLENDGLYEQAEFVPAVLEELSREDILKRIQEGGVVGMGGAGFPTHVKLSPKDPQSIEYVLVNGAECEPYLTSDYRRMLESPEMVVGGLRVMLALFENAQGYICIEDNKQECVEKLRELVKNIPRMEVKELMTKYPQGGERTLIYAATGREINSSMLPADVGCVVDNVDTVCAIYRAVIEGRPVMDRIVTVTGEGIKNPKNFEVFTGTDMAELIEAAGGLKDNVPKVISGGPMMGFPLYDLHVPCVKTSSACLCLQKDAVLEAQQTACINCGRCVKVCPGHVLPSKLATFAEHGDMENFQKFDGLECCECGCCSYVCPAKRPLTQSIKSMRKMVLASRKKR
jgi:electron transport complex protein RnfC